MEETGEEDVKSTYHRLPDPACDQQEVHQEQETCDRERLQEGIEEGDKTQRQEKVLRPCPHIQDDKRRKVLFAMVQDQDC